jgi:hypothetical protein
LALPIVSPVERFVGWYYELTMSGSSSWSDLTRLLGKELCFNSDGSDSLLSEQFESYSLLPGEGGIFCLENIASMPSFRFVIGSMKLADSVPTLPTSLGTG